MTHDIVRTESAASIVYSGPIFEPIAALVF